MRRGYKKSKSGETLFYGGAYNWTMGLRAWSSKAEAIKGTIAEINSLIAKQKDFANLGVTGLWDKEIKREKKELDYVRRAN